MAPSNTMRVLLLSATLSLVTAAALPEPTRVPVGVVEVRAPVVTPAAIRFDGSHSYVERDIIDSIKSGADSVAASWKSVLGTDLPQFFTDGIPGWFDNLPNSTAALSKAGVGDDVASKPTQVLNVPPYANWTDKGWNVRFHGNVYKFPNISQDKVDSLANGFLIGTSMKDLSASEQDQARNLTRSIYIVQQGDQNVSMSLEPAPSQGGDGEPGGGNAIPATGGTQNLTLPYPTTEEGDFDVFVPIASNGLLPGNVTNQNVQRLNVYAQGAPDSGNATAFLVPNEGITFISDIDDILRVTKIWNPEQGILNSFAKPFTPWMNMPDIYANWSRSLPNNTHFHYLTTTPEQATRNYMDFIYKTYPGGSFDTRPLNFSNGQETLKVRKFLLDKVFETFPQRKFVLIADTSNSDVMKAYPQLAHERPNQVACILLRNTTATDISMWFPYDTSGFKGLNNNTYLFFRTPDDLTNLDISSGNCVNKTFAQNVTFARQRDGSITANKSAGGKIQGSATISFIVALAATMAMVL